MSDIPFNIILLPTPKSPKSVLARVSIANFIFICTIQSDSLITQNCTSLRFPSVNSTKFTLLPICLLYLRRISCLRKCFKDFKHRVYQIFVPKTEEIKLSNKLNFVSKFLVRNFFFCQKQFIVPKPAHSVTEVCR